MLFFGGTIIRWTYKSKTADRYWLFYQQSSDIVVFCGWYDRVLR